MQKKIKKSILKEVAKASRVAAWGGGGLPTWFGFFEPEIPEKLQEMRRKESK